MQTYRKNTIVRNSKDDKCVSILKGCENNTSVQTLSNYYFFIFP